MAGTLAASAGALAAPDSPIGKPAPAAKPAPALRPAAAPSKLDRMIGEMLIMGFKGSDLNAPGPQSIVNGLRRGDIGGAIFFADNAPSPEATKRLTRAFRDAYGHRALRLPILSVDQEGGAIVRLRADRGFEPLPSAQQVAAMSPQAAEALYARTAKQLSELGFNLNFGPVVDLAINQRSRIISGLGRSYGVDSATVVQYAKAFVDAHRRNHVFTALKHFPGHGSTAADSHRTLPDISGTWSREEMRPFAELTNSAYADMVMVGHLVHADLTEPGRPASLSQKAIQDVLRKGLNYQGVIVSDDMQMGALRNSFSPDERILLGVEAGLDLFIYSNREFADPDMPRRFHRVINAAIETGRLTKERIEESAKRIAFLKSALQFESAALVE